MPEHKTDPSGTTGSNRKTSSLLVDVVLSCLLIAVFAAGAVLLFAGLTSRDAGSPGSTTAAQEAERVFSGIELILKDAEAVRLLEPDETGLMAPPLEFPAVEVTADLDGDRSTGSFDSNDSPGLEQLLICRQSGTPGDLVALVFMEPGQVPARVVLTSCLNPDEERALIARITPLTPGDGSLEGYQLELVLVLKVDDAVESHSRSFNVRGMGH